MCGEIFESYEELDKLIKKVKRNKQAAIIKFGGAGTVLARVNSLFAQADEEHAEAVGKANRALEHQLISASTAAGAAEESSNSRDPLTDAAIEELHRWADEVERDRDPRKPKDGG